MFDVLTGAALPAGRLPVTQYPAGYVSQNNILDMNLWPSNGIPGPHLHVVHRRSPPYAFDHGLYYTTFSTGLDG